MREASHHTVQPNQHPRNGREARALKNNGRLNSLHRDLVETERQIRSIRTLINYPELATPLDRIVNPETRLDGLVKRRDFLRRELEDAQRRFVERQGGRS